MPRKRKGYKDVGRRKVVEAHRKSRTPEQSDIEATQARCPEGHALPHRTVNGSCTPVYCAGGEATEKTAKVLNFSAMGKAGKRAQVQKSKVLEIVSQEADRVIDALIPETVPGWQQAREAAKQQKGEELMRLAQGIGRYAAMKSYFNVPEGLTGADAEAWVQKRSVELSVDALAEFERQMKLGDDSQRLATAEKVLRMNGMDKKEAPPQANAVIILNNPAGLAGMPWLKPAAAQVVEAPAPAHKEIAEDAEKHS